MEDKVGLPLCGGSIAFLDLEGYTGRQDQQLSREKDSGQKGNARRIWTLIVSEGEKHISFDLYNQSKVSRATTIPIAHMRKSSLREIKGFMEYS